MNNYNTLFGQLLSQVKRPEFDKLCKTVKSDKFRKDFTTWDQFVVMVFAQITGQHGLRSIENAMNCQMSSFYHLGLSKEIKRSTISYANKNHGSKFFEALYYQLKKFEAGGSSGERASRREPGAQEGLAGGGIVYRENFSVDGLE